MEKILLIERKRHNSEECEKYSQNKKCFNCNETIKKNNRISIVQYKNGTKPKPICLKCLEEYQTHGIQVLNSKTTKAFKVFGIPTYTLENLIEK